MLAIGPFFFVGGFVFQIVMSPVNRWRRHPQHGRAQVAALGENGVIFTWKGGDETWAWFQIRKVLATERLIVLVGGQDRFRMVSKSAFGSPEEAGRFQDECAARLGVPGAFPLSSVRPPVSQGAREGAA